MSPTLEVALIVEKDLVRSLKSAKGIILALITFAGGFLTTWLTIAAQNRAKEKLGTEQSRMVREEALKAAYDADIGRYMADAPDVLIFMMVLTLATASFLAAFVGYDTIAGELQYRSVRYVTMRARRTSYVLGKTLGIFAMSALMTFLIHLIAWILLIAKTDTGVGDTLSWGLRLWLLSLPVAFAWSGLVTFASSLVKTPILALLLSFLVTLVTWFTHGIGRAYEYGWITWVHPGGFDRLLLSPKADQLLLGLAASFGWGGLFVGATIFLFMRRDV